ncbi:L,D-transpeptidase [Actinoplanes sp. NEAU-A12]|uniref:L,D-transpeptidase n=1 Tax=Actinoplanes sandaracinus TaxID=3045177 RepID=A0ABT6WMI6_9ACTN|nr:L,D-transpeptidase [Actinoplanes sandaracinus]MDI6100932.1 L,D-transpeptidase [Actinoplanes sandaracinus]
MPISRSRLSLVSLTAVALIVAVIVAVGLARGSEPDAAQPSTPASAAPSASVSAAASPTVPPAAEPPAGMPVIAYAKGPRGLPADPDPESVVPVTEALRPTTRIALYDAPGGRARAWLPPRISGLPVVAPIVARENGWAAVLVPAANRRIGWVPEAGWRAEPLRDQLLVNLAARRLTWLRDGAEQGRWSVAIGADRSPTPLGRTFVLGRTGTSGAVYAGLDALVLGSVPDEPEKLAASLQGAHTGIHAWSNSSAFGRDVSNGCVRTPAAVQRKLLAQVDPGTPVVVTP